MLLLSNDRAIDISIARAKYHALRQQGPAPDAEHRALYCLVDIVFRLYDDNGKPRRGWTEYDYKYSGFTLANIHKENHLNEEDKATILSWASLPTQKAKIETVRRRLVDTQTNLSTKLDSSPSFLYSSLYKRIHALNLNSARPDQWLSTITNMKNTGLREEEIIWSDINKFLSIQNNKTNITKQHVLSAIDFNNINLQVSCERIRDTNGGLMFNEVAEVMPHQAVHRASLKLDDNKQCILRYIDPNFNYRIGVIKSRIYQADNPLNNKWFAFDPYGRALINERGNTNYFKDSEDAKSAADKHARKIMKLCYGTRFNTHYDHLTLYGGDHYREWIVSLPEYQRNFFGAHYYDHNVLMHIRTTSRRDTSGNKLLFIEEIQSDWHQQGHVHGYNNSPWGNVANAPFKKEWPVLAIKLMLIRASNNGFDGIAWADGDIQETRYSQYLTTIKRRYDKEIPHALNRLGKDFNCQVDRTNIETRDPWLNVVKSKDKWHVADNHGKFETKNKYNSREEAMLVIHRHCKEIQLGVSVFIINKQLQYQLSEKGLPLFGENL